MAYCTIDDLRRILPENVKIGDTNIGTPQPGRTATKRSNITPAEAQKYILYGQQYVDGKLRPMYITPLRRVKTFQTEILSDVAAGTSISITVPDANYFLQGDIVRLQNKSQMEESEVESITDATTVVLTSVSASYTVADESQLSQLRYPEPIPVITARMACSYVLDRLFVAQQSPDVSRYGATQRNLASNEMDDILSGETRLFGQEHSGRRFVRGTLFDAYDSPAEVQKGQEKE